MTSQLKGIMIGHIVRAAFSWHFLCSVTIFVLLQSLSCHVLCRVTIFVPVRVSRVVGIKVSIAILRSRYKT